MDLPLGVGSDVRQGRTRSSRCAGQQEIKSYPEIDSRVGNRWHGRIVGPATCRPSPRLCRELIGVDCGVMEEFGQFTARV
jgi:hypothetical protein